MTCVWHLDTPEMIRQLSKGQFDGDIDPREQALYTPADAACYLGINPQTLSSWLWGRKYPIVGGEKFFSPLIDVADKANELLSFYNLAEIHVLGATRYKHHVPMKAVRTAIDTVQQRYPSVHPLISKDFKTNGKDLFIQSLDETANVSTPWQLNFKLIMDQFLEHVITDEHDLVKKIFPSYRVSRMTELSLSPTASHPVSQ